jgi:alpha-1,3/alpha-1,6-mannosyltransferase
VRVAFLHPELGLGGAERLVTDAAAALVARGHQVAVFTSRWDPARGFPAAAALDVRVHGRRLPAHVFQRLRAPAAIARMAVLALAATREPWDAIVTDLVAHVLPLVRRRSAARRVFYCHFPDRLLAPARPALAGYRAAIDALEAHGLAAADRVLVNSRFTARRLREAYPRLATLDPEVLHPGVDPVPAGDAPEAATEPLLLAVGRFDPAKNLGLAVDTLAALRARLPGAPLRLVVAGGYDARLVEQRRTLAALGEQAARAGLADRVTLAPSAPDTALRDLLSRALCVLYTPVEEHFGYVPLEAMAAGRPVVAAAGGGPAETVVDGETGFLRPPAAEPFADAVARLLADRALAARMGAAGRAHVARHFSRDEFGRRFEAALRG